MWKFRSPARVFFKDGVSLRGIQPVAVQGIVIAADVFAQWHLRFTVTSVVDGRHSENSLHYEGLAFDIRTRDDGPSYEQWSNKEQIAQALRNALGAEWDVVVESTHIHVEFDPK